MNKTEFKIYLAGLFDGDGSVGVYSTNMHNAKVCLMRCSIGLRRAEETIILMDRIKKEYKGHIHYSKDRILRWYSGSKNALLFLEDIKKYSILKKEQIRLAINFQKYTTSQGKNFNIKSHDKVYNKQITWIEKIRRLKTLWV